MTNDRPFGDARDDGTSGDGGNDGKNDGSKWAGQSFLLQKAGDASAPIMKNRRQVCCFMNYSAPCVFINL